MPFNSRAQTDSHPDELFETETEANGKLMLTSFLSLILETRLPWVNEWPAILPHWSTNLLLEGVHPHPLQKFEQPKGRNYQDLNHRSITRTVWQGFSSIGWRILSSLICTGSSWNWPTLGHVSWYNWHGPPSQCVTQPICFFPLSSMLKTKLSL